MNDLIVKTLRVSIDQLKEEIARTRAFNTGLCLGMKLSEESDLYHKFKYLDVVPDRLNKTVSLLQNLLDDLEEENKPNV